MATHAARPRPVVLTHKLPLACRRSLRQAPAPPAPGTGTPSGRPGAGAFFHPGTPVPLPRWCRGGRPLPATARPSPWGAWDGGSQGVGFPAPANLSRFTVVLDLAGLTNGMHGLQCLISAESSEDRRPSLASPPGASALQEKTPDHPLFDQPRTPIDGSQGCVQGRRDAQPRRAAQPQQAVGRRARGDTLAHVLWQRWWSGRVSGSGTPRSAVQIKS